MKLDYNAQNKIYKFPVDAHLSQKFKTRFFIDYDKIKCE